MHCHVAHIPGNTQTYRGTYREKNHETCRGQTNKHIVNRTNIVNVETLRHSLKQLWGPCISSFIFVALYSESGLMHNMYKVGALLTLPEMLMLD